MWGQRFEDLASTGEFDFWKLCADTHFATRPEQRRPQRQSQLSQAFYQFLRWCVLFNFLLFVTENLLDHEFEPRSRSWNSSTPRTSFGVSLSLWTLLARVLNTRLDWGNIALYHRLHLAPDSCGLFPQPACIQTAPYPPLAVSLRGSGNKQQEVE